MNLKEYSDVNIKACLNIALANKKINFTTLLKITNEIGQDKLISKLTSKEVEVLKKYINLEDE